jgi:hypothetical protein
MDHDLDFITRQRNQLRVELASQAKLNAELEGKLERCVRLAAYIAETMDPSDIFESMDVAEKVNWNHESWFEHRHHIRAAIESPNSGERREGE